MRRATLAFVLLLFAPFLRGAQWSRPALLTESRLEPAEVSENLKIATDGEIILGAWAGADFGGSLFIQRWTIEGDLLEPTPHVIHHGRDGLFESAYAYAPRVDDVIWTGTEFLVVWSNDKTVVIDTIDRELRHTTRSEIAFTELPRFVRATAREILMIRGTTADFYTTSGRFISSIPLVIPGSSVEALDAASDGERFLLSGVFSNSGDVALYTIAIHSNRSASQAVIVPLDTWSWYYAIDVTFGAERFLVTTVYSSERYAHLSDVRRLSPAISERERRC